MRWWPWGERAEPEPEPEAAGSTAAPPRPAPQESWRSLAPVSRTVADHEPVFKTLAFADDLASWRAPTFVEELRHELSPSGPIGVMAGITTTIPAAPRTASPAPGDRPVRDFHPAPPRRLPALQRVAAGPATAGRSTVPDLVRSPPPDHEPFVVPVAAPPEGAPPARPDVDDRPDPSAGPPADVALLGDRGEPSVLASAPSPVDAPPPVTPPAPAPDADGPRTVRLGLGPPLPARPTGLPPVEGPAPAVASPPVADAGQEPTGAASPGAEVTGAPSGHGPPADGSGAPVVSRTVPLLGAVPPPTSIAPVVGGPVRAAPPAGGASDRPSADATSGRSVQRQHPPGAPAGGSSPTAGPPAVAAPGASPAVGADDAPRSPVAPPPPEAISTPPPSEPAPVDAGASPPPATVVDAPLLGARPIETVQGTGVPVPEAAAPSTPAGDGTPHGGGGAAGTAAVQRRIDVRGPTPSGPVPVGPADGEPTERPGHAPSTAEDRPSVSVAVLARRPIEPVVTAPATADPAALAPPVAAAPGPSSSSVSSSVPGSGRPGPVAAAPGPSPWSPSSVPGSGRPGPVALAAVQRSAAAPPDGAGTRALFEPIEVPDTSLAPIAVSTSVASVVEPDPAPGSTSPLAAAPVVSGPSTWSVPVVPGRVGPRPTVSRSPAPDAGRAPVAARTAWPAPVALTPPWRPAESSGDPAEGREPVARAVDPAAHLAPVQREEAVASAPEPEPAPAAPSATVSVGGPPAPSGDGAGLIGSDDQIDQLAKRLYPRIRDRIRTEARLDRERAGRGLDVRR